MTVETDVSFGEGTVSNMGLRENRGGHLLELAIYFPSADFTKEGLAAALGKRC